LARGTGSGRRGARNRQVAQRLIGARRLIAAAQPTARVRAVVSRGGRPDLARDALASVTAPTLLISGAPIRS
jgi:hypothetical protein